MMIGMSTYQPRRTSSNVQTKTKPPPVETSTTHPTKGRWRSIYRRLFRGFMGQLTARSSTIEDCAYLAPRLRKADLDEVTASGHGSTLLALQQGYVLSDECYT